MKAGVGIRMDNGRKDEWMDGQELMFGPGLLLAQHWGPYETETRRENGAPVETPSVATEDGKAGRRLAQADIDKLLTS